MMTSEMIQNKYAQVNTISSVPKAFRGRLALARDQSFLDGTQDIFDLLSRKQYSSNSSWEKNLDTTLSFLESARILLKDAEAKISAQNKHLKIIEHIADVDPLTGLLNGTGLAKALSREIARTNRGYNDGGLLVIFSLENLETIKSDQGDSAAKDALLLVARALEKDIRDMDLAARIHEDEFVLLFTDTSMNKALNRLQNMAIRLNRLALATGRSDIRLNLSLGLKDYAQGAKADQIFKDVTLDLKRNRQGAVQKA